MSSTPPPIGHLRLNVNLPADLHKQFKVAAAARGSTMSDLVTSMVQGHLFPNASTTASFNETEMAVIQWAEARHIIPNSTPLAQAIKTTEEVAELLKALSKGDVEEAKDAYGDILVTLVIGAALLDVDLKQCFAQAYEVIKDRRGYLTKDGIFVKEAA